MTNNQLIVRTILDQWGIDPNYQIEEHMADMTVHALECENIASVKLTPTGVLEIEFYDYEPGTI